MMGKIPGLTTAHSKFELRPGEARYYEEDYIDHLKSGLYRNLGGLIETEGYGRFDDGWDISRNRRRLCASVIVVSDPKALSDAFYELEMKLKRAEETIAEMLDIAENPRDEYHTMEELYEYRMLYNAMAANARPDISVKSLRHSDGEYCFGANSGYFVVSMNLPTGQVNNHYKTKDWDQFQIPEVFVPPEWDGHTPDIAAARLRAFNLEGQ